MDNTDFDKLASIFESEDAELFKVKEKRPVVTADDRLKSSFLEIVDFVKKNGREPKSDSTDMAEFKLGARLENLRSDKKKSESLAGCDELGLLKTEEAPKSLDELFSDDSGLFGEDDIFKVDKLPNNGQPRNSGTIAKREAAQDFANYKPLFDEKQAGLAEGRYILRKFSNQAEIVEGGFYISGGQMCYVESIKAPKMTFGRMKSRLHVIYENGTESNIYLRTLSSELYHDDGFIVVDKEYYLAKKNTADDKPVTGRIYVAKSQSEDPKIKEIANLYKIGMTNDTVEKRIANAENEPTYLMAPVLIVDTYELYGNYNTEKVETALHRFFADANLDLEAIGRDGIKYKATEWYSVPIWAIRQAIDLLNAGEIVNFVYDGKKQEIVELNNQGEDYVN